MNAQEECTKAGSPYLNLTAEEQLTWLLAANEALYKRMEAEVAKNGRRTDAWEIMADEYDQRDDLIGMLRKEIRVSEPMHIGPRDKANTET